MKLEAYLGSREAILYENSERVEIVYLSDVSYLTEAEEEDISEKKGDAEYTFYGEIPNEYFNRDVVITENWKNSGLLEQIVEPCSNRGLKSYVPNKVILRTKINRSKIKPLIKLK